MLTPSINSLSDNSFVLIIVLRLFSVISLLFELGICNTYCLNTDSANSSTSAKLKPRVFFDNVVIGTPKSKFFVSQISYTTFLSCLWAASNSILI